MQNLTARVLRTVELLLYALLVVSMRKPTVPPTGNSAFLRRSLALLTHHLPLYRLLRAARDTRNPYSLDYKVLVHIVQAEHIQAAQGYIRSAKITRHLVREIQEECSQVVKLLEAAQTLGEITPRCMDRVISTGEKLSCRFLSALLCDRGVSSAYVDLSEAVDLPASNVIDQSYYDTLTASIGRKIQECESRVPVVTGYFGIVPGGLLQKIGRGYTDLCAALVAVGISATELQIWKEVDGIFTANPKVVPTAKLLSTITPAEASELTFYGSEVIHPFAMKQVMRARIPIRIAGVMNPRGSGTIVLPERLPRPETGFSTRKSKLIRSRASEEPFNHRNSRKLTAVTTKDNILVINVYSTERSLSHSFFARIFDVLDKWKLSVDLMATSEVQVSMALHSEAPLLSGSGDDDYQIVNQDLYGAIHELCSYGCVDLIPGMAILSLVGKEMKNMTGIAGSMFFTLAENDIDIEMISQGLYLPFILLMELPLTLSRFIQAQVRRTYPALLMRGMRNAQSASYMLACLIALMRNSRR